MQAGRYTSIFKSEEQNWWYKGRRKLVFALVRSLSGEKKLKILDIGCGTGRNMLLLQRFGDVYGVDPSLQAINFCKHRGLKQAYRVRNNTYPFSSSCFDLVTCLDVLEHEGDQRALLGEANRVLKRGGHFLITAPAYPILWSKLDTDSHHKRRYLKASLEKTLAQSGFSVERISYFNYLLFLPILIIRLFQKTHLGKNTTWGIRPDFESKTLNRVLSPLFAIDIALLPYISSPFGVSLVAIAKKIS